MSTLRFHPSPAARPQPGGSRPASAMFQWLWRLAGQFGQRRSPSARNATEEANQVRAMAQEIRRSDPRVAADLFAAADRHERLYG